MDRMMNKERALRWMLEFGREWVPNTKLNDTWADYEIHWLDNARAGYLDRKIETFSAYYRLTDRSMKLLEDDDED